MSKLAKINENTSAYLRKLTNLANKLPTSMSNILKTSYMAQCDSIESESNIPKTEGYLTRICPTCKIDISESAIFSLIPKKCSKFEKSLKKRIENCSQLTEYQKRYAKHMRIASDHEQIAFNITCNICNTNTKKVISKWKHQSKKRKATENPIVIEDADRQRPPKKKKKKQIDQFVGLNKEVIQSLKKLIHPVGQQEEVKKIPFNPRLKPIIVTNNKRNKRKTTNNEAGAIMKNKNKLSQILGASLRHNSGKSSNLNHFFGSF